MKARGVAGRLGEIAICGALFAMRPPTYIEYAIRAARLKLHPHLTIPPIRPAGDTGRRIIKESAAPAFIGCTHQHQLNRRAALEAAKGQMGDGRPLVPLAMEQKSSSLPAP